MEEIFKKIRNSKKNTFSKTPTYTSIPNLAAMLNVDASIIGLLIHEAKKKEEINYIQTSFEKLYCVEDVRKLVLKSTKVV
jgi:hypothetical protein